MYKKINEKPLKKVRYVEQKASLPQLKTPVPPEDIDDFIYADKALRHSER